MAREWGRIHKLLVAGRMMIYLTCNKGPEERVEPGGGLVPEKIMLQGWKNMHPEQRYIQ